MASVLVVGGGPAGLVAAKTLLNRPYRPFKVSVYEAADKVGGMWAGDTKCHPKMRINLSRFTVSFSDQPWIPDPSTGELRMFPHADSVGLYLSRYASTFLSKANIQCNREVKSADLVDGSWRVKSYCKVNKAFYEEQFNFLVVASGFFGSPNKSSFWDEDGPAVKKVHTSQFRSVRGLTDGKPGNIVVFGGGISGSEAAASAAFQISNAKYLPGDGKRNWANSTIYHVLERPFYCLPRYLPQNGKDGENFNPAPNFLPLDLQLYNTSRRGEGAISASSGRLPAEKAKKAHAFIRSMIGGDQSDLGRQELVYNDERTQYPAYTGISDFYSEFVRSGVIKPVQGRVTGVESYVSNEFTVKVSQIGPFALDGNDFLSSKYEEIEQSGSESDQETDSLQVQDTVMTDRDAQESFDNSEKSSFGNKSVGESGVRTIADVVGIVEATGYQTEIPYLSDDVKLALGYDANSKRIPFLLSNGSIFNKNVPEIAFIGFYEGPYWGVMEAQANVLANTWDAESPETYELYDVRGSRETRSALKQRDLRIPQFWMADYVGLVEQLNRIAGVSRNDFVAEDPIGYVFPARYTNGGCDGFGAEYTIDDVHKTVEAAEQNCRFVAAAVFRGLQGTWAMERHSSKETMTYEGYMAYFHPRHPTEQKYSSEYLCVEDGKAHLRNESGSFNILSINKSFVFRYSEVTDLISIWTVKKDNRSADTHFGTLTFERPTEAGKGWKATAFAQNIPGGYGSEIEYEFVFQGANLKEWKTTQRTVPTNPQQEDSTSVWTTYTRQKEEDTMRGWRTFDDLRKQYRSMLDE